MESYIFFCNYQITEYSDLVEQEYPIYVKADNIESELGWLDINCDIDTNPFTYDDLVNEGIGITTTKILIEGPALLNLGDHCIPYICLQLKNYPSYLFVCLLYPHEPFLIKSYAYNQIPKTFLNFFCEVGNGNTHCFSLSLPALPNWCDTFKQVNNTPKIDRDIYNLIITRFAGKSLINYFSQYFE